MSPGHKTGAPFSKRRLGLAGLAAILGCAVCCALPLLAAAGLGSGVAAGMGRVLRPGSELIVGGIVFVVALALMTIRRRLRRHAACGPSCHADGGCCDHGHAAT